MEEQELLSSETARVFLGVSRTTMHRLVQNGEVRRLKVGGQWRFQKADLLAHLERKPVAIAAKSLPELDAELAWWSEQAGAAPSEEVTSPEEKIAALANMVFTVAIGRGASDVHFEPGSDAARLRVRVDGALETAREMPTSVLVALVNRLKEWSQMSLEENRVPQDGRILLSHGGQKFDLRLTTCPTTRGETLTMSVLAEAKRLQLDALGLSEEQLAQVGDLAARPNGLILLCGGRGSGKTTTFYALLESLQTDATKIVTLEDPPEATLPGALQTPVNRRAGLTFASMMRAFLRLDPDIIGVGDLPDIETLESAVQGALGGHLVIAQMNVPSIGEAIVRLRDMGLESFLLGAALRGLVAQTFVRRVCPDCTQSVELSPPVAMRLEEIAQREEFALPQTANWQRGAGCAKCRQTGYRGRLALFQVVEESDELKTAILDGEDAGELAGIARESGSRTLWQSGLERAANGETTTDELLRVLAM